MTNTNLIEGQANNLNHASQFFYNLTELDRNGTIALTGSMFFEGFGRDWDFIISDSAFKTLKESNTILESGTKMQIEPHYRDRLIRFVYELYVCGIKIHFQVTPDSSYKLRVAARDYIKHCYPLVQEEMLDKVKRVAIWELAYKHCAPNDI